MRRDIRDTVKLAANIYGLVRNTGPRFELLDEFQEIELAKVRGKPKPAIKDPFFYYGALYASQAYFQRGGRAWSEWYTEMRSYLLRKQKSDGRWVDQAYGDEFGTAVAALILAMPIQYLPIFQR